MAKCFETDNLVGQPARATIFGEERGGCYREAEVAWDCLPDSAVRPGHSPADNVIGILSAPPAK
jgi:hypothetical protein